MLLEFIFWKSFCYWHHIPSHGFKLSRNGKIILKTELREKDHEDMNWTELTMIVSNSIKSMNSSQESLLSIILTSVVAWSSVMKHWVFGWWSFKPILSMDVSQRSVVSCDSTSSLRLFHPIQAVLQHAPKVKDLRINPSWWWQCQLRSSWLCHHVDL